jgi:hypothetical protein
MPRSQTIVGPSLPRELLQWPSAIIPKDPSLTVGICFANQLDSYRA